MIAYVKSSSLVQHPCKSKEDLLKPRTCKNVNIPVFKVLQNDGVSPTGVADAGIGDFSYDERKLFCDVLLCLRVAYNKKDMA